MEYNIRKTTTADFDAIMEVEKQAFGYDKEARLVAQLLNDETAKPFVSLLAFDKGEAIGHILFTRAYFGSLSGETCLSVSGNRWNAYKRRAAFIADDGVGSGLRLRA